MSTLGVRVEPELGVRVEPGFGVTVKQVKAEVRSSSGVRPEAYSDSDSQAWVSRVRVADCTS